MPAAAVAAAQCCHLAANPRRRIAAAGTARASSAVAGDTDGARRRDATTTCSRKGCSRSGIGRLLAERCVPPTAGRYGCADRHIGSSSGLDALTQGQIFFPVADGREGLATVVTARVAPVGSFVASRVVAAGPGTVLTAHVCHCRAVAWMASVSLDWTSHDSRKVWAEMFQLA